MLQQLKENNFDIAVIQEAHMSSEEALFTRGEVPGYGIIGTTLHKSYGTACTLNVAWKMLN